MEPILLLPPTKHFNWQPGDPQEPSPEVSTGSGHRTEAWQVGEALDTPLPTTAGTS